MKLAFINTLTDLADISAIHVVTNEAIKPHLSPSNSIQVTDYAA